MTPRQQRFVDEYLVDLNATQAAIRAGYSTQRNSPPGWFGECWDRRGRPGGPAGPQRPRAD